MDVKFRKKLLAFIQFVFIFNWVSHLIYTDSYFSVYALTCAVAMACLCDNYFHSRQMEKLPLVLNLTISSLLSFAVTLANYPIFQRLRDMEIISYDTNSFLNVYEAVLTFVGGIIVFYHIFLCIASRFPAVCEDEKHSASGKHPAAVFFGAFGALTVIYLIYLFFVVYPGSVTSDSIWQISQIVNDAHTNHHPYWHTMSIKLLLTVGYFLFEDSNAAAATFSAVQSMAMAACFAYAVVTLYQYRIPKIWIFLTFAAFACLPNHIAYSCTMWKDVPFGGAVLVLVVAMFRVVRRVGNSKFNYVMLMIGGIATCIFRSNGLYAMLAAFVVLALFFRKRCKELLIPWVSCLVIGYVLTGPALTALGVANVNFIEGLSVPLQQVARVITYGGELTEEEIREIDTILNIDEVPENYNEQCVDAIKDMIHLKNYDYLLDNKGTFLKIWLDIGARYPWEYVEAWVEETKGYWNGGYDYYIYAEYVSENDYGMFMPRKNNLIHNLVKAYFTLTRETVLFEPIQSIGLAVWVLSILCFFNLVHNRKEFLLTVPVLAVVFTLWLTTPVFSEFRYAYSIFTTLPFILTVSLFRRAEEVDA